MPSGAFPIYALPGFLKLATQLTDARAREVKTVGDFLRSKTGGKHFGDLPAPLRHGIQPLTDVDPSGRSLSRCGSSVFDNDFLPTVGLAGLDTDDFETPTLTGRPREHFAASL